MAFDIENTFSHHPPTPGKISAHADLREYAKRFAYVIEGAVPDGREKSLAITKLQEALMWANAGVALAPASEYV